MIARFYGGPPDLDGLVREVGDPPPRVIVAYGPPLLDPPPGPPPESPILAPEWRYLRHAGPTAAEVVYFYDEPA